ncbi:MAG TPA: hypothetical protein VGM19_14765 [Armatimonadota bacterium]|jgi:dipeptidyl aminopeptidase/acylaminoacyl peptidase
MRTSVFTSLALGAALLLAVPFVQAETAAAPPPMVVVREDNLWMLDGNGENPQRLTTSGDCSSPTCSPEGSRIAYVRGTDYRQRSLWVLDVAKGTATQLVGAVSGYSYPRWSPDGKSVAYFWIDDINRSTVDYDYFQLVRFDVASQAVKILAKDLIGPLGLAWAPDSSALAYSTGYAGKSRLALISATDGEVAVPELASLDRDQEQAEISGVNWLPTGEIVYVTDLPAAEDTRQIKVYQANLEGEVKTLYENHAATTDWQWSLGADSRGRLLLCWQSSLWLVQEGKAIRLAENATEVGCR